MKTKDMTTPHLRESIGRSHLRLGSLLVPLLLGCFAISPSARAVCQEGCNPSLFNAFLGDDALFSNTTGTGNTALGWRSLFSNTDASFSTGVGAGALVLNNGSSNTAVGTVALLLNASGAENTAVGTDALVFNDSGGFNSAVGAFALSSNTVGASNNAFGDHALFANTTGFLNVAVGSSALVGNTSGNNNIGIGFFGGSSITTGNNVIAVGTVGVSSVFGQVDNACYIGSIYNQPVDATAPLFVLVDADGKLGTFPMNANGNKATVPSPLGLQQQATLNRKVEEQQATISELKSTVAQQQKAMEVLTAQFKDQAAQIQKVGAQLEASKPAPQVVKNND
jgi:uncharacterized coiled-coil protein SlyX